LVSTGGEGASTTTSFLALYLDEEVITGYDETTSYKTWYVLVAQLRSSFPQACAAAVRQRASIMHSESMATLPVVVLPSLVIHEMC
jgi:hypothetical protein